MILKKRASPKLITGNIGNWQHFHTGNIPHLPISWVNAFRLHAKGKVKFAICME